MSVQNMGDKDGRMREYLAEAHQMIYRHGLVTWTSGNISYRLGPDEILIKPSGVPYAHLTGQIMVRCNMEGKSVDANPDLKPSTDVFAHCYIYRNWGGSISRGGPPIGSIVHTHSPYATAFAARGMAIPCSLTAIADEFGGEIPCAEYATIGGDEIGLRVIETLQKRYCAAVLLKNHGVFTFGPNIEQAVKAAVMVEDVARTVWLAMQLSFFGDEIDTLPPEEIRIAHERYKNYGR
jgi:L-ribulose-5-phosphate 4-epimerase